METRRDPAYRTPNGSRMIPWVIGALAAIAIVAALVYGMSGNDRTASTGARPENTGSTTTAPKENAPAFPEKAQERAPAPATPQRP